MKSLAIAWEPCVRTRARAATCRGCVDACPTGALDLSGPRDSVAADLSKCTECGLCQSACPTEAISTSFETAAFLASASGTIRCGEGLPCVGALHAEDLVVLALRRGPVTLEAASSCAHERGHAAAVARAAEAERFLATLGVDRGVKVVPARESERPPAAVKSDAAKPARETEIGKDRAPPKVPARRAFFAGLLSPLEPARLEPAAPPPPRSPDEARAPSVPRSAPVRLEMDSARLDIQAMRRPATSARRDRLLEALPREAPEGAKIPEALAGFTSGKVLNTVTCTICMLCVNVCPTGALSTPPLRRELRFDASRCVKCATCHEVCEPGALTLGPTLDVRAFAAREVASLGRFAVQACGECGALFKREGAQVLCPRCRDLDDEIRELRSAR